MKHYFKLSNLLFYLLVTLLFSFLGMVFAGITGAGKGQGLAGGAFVFGYGVITAVLAFIASIFIAQLLGSPLVIRLNKILLFIVAVMLALISYRYQTRHVPLKQSFYQNAEMLFPSVQAASLQTNQATTYKLPMGLGMAAPDFYNNKEIFFYGNPNLEKAVLDHTPTEELAFLRSETGISIKTAPPWFVPAHLKMDYNVLNLRLISVSPEFIEVMVNERTGQTTYMDRSKNKLIYWPEFLLSINSVEPVSREDNPVRIKPLNHAAVVSKAYSFLQPLKIRRQWMQVELQDDDYKSHGKGWVKWKDKGELIISYSLFS